MANRRNTREVKLGCVFTQKGWDEQGYALRQDKGLYVDPEDLEGIDDYIRQLAKLDPNSFSFRYAEAKTGDPSVPADLKHINLRHFADLMERLANYLDGIDTETDLHREFKAELEAEYRSDMASDGEW